MPKQLKANVYVGQDQDGNVVNTWYGPDFPEAGDPPAGLVGDHAYGEEGDDELPPVPGHSMTLQDEENAKRRDEAEGQRSRRGRSRGRDDDVTPTEPEQGRA